MSAPMILFVDDEPLVVDVVRNILKRGGFRFLTASGADEAEILFGEHADEIDLLVTDVVMPNVNGRELYERLRALRPELPVVFVSGFVNDPRLAETMDDVRKQQLLEKPFRPEQLLTAIQRGLDASSSGLPPGA